MSSLAAKLLKAKAALGLDDDDAPAKEPKSKPKQHRVDGGIDKSKKKVRLVVNYFQLKLLPMNMNDI